MKKTLFVGNWKMQPENAGEAAKLFSATKRAAGRAKKVAVVVCPPFAYLSALFQSRDGSVLLGAQDVSVFTDGAHTGEISTAMLKSFLVRYVIVGHSERRAYGEDDSIIALKAKNALSAGMKAVLCVGEKERGEHGEHLAFLQEQLTASLKGIGKAHAKNLVVAYEPLWAIGKSYKYSMKPEEIHEAALFIRKILTKLFGRSAAAAIPILYGGSVEAENITALVREGQVDGVLVGHASLHPQQVAGMISALEGKK